MFSLTRLCSLIEISLDVDADRDGIVERNNPNKVYILSVLLQPSQYT